LGHSLLTSGAVQLNRRAGDRLLIVRHGPNRGPRIRLSPYRAKFFQPALDDFARRFPPLHEAIAIWETGSPLPHLRSTSAVVFLLADPLKELYPGCYEEAREIARQAGELGVRVVNHPAALSNTIKSRQAGLLAQAGVPTPRHAAFSTHQRYREAVELMRFPAIVRADLLHAQQKMLFCKTRKEALALEPSRIPLPGSIAEFVDTREGFRQAQPDSIWATHYHKKRAYVFGEQVINNHVFFGLEPIVGCKTSTFGHYRSLNPIRRYIQTARCRPHIDLDYQYFLDDAPPVEADMLRRAARALNLDFVAVDYSSKADGSIVVWELNPHFCMHAWPFDVLGGPRRIRERTSRFHDAAGNYFRTLLEVPR
jgi:hypothetical protein